MSLSEMVQQEQRMCSAGELMMFLQSPYLMHVPSCIFCMVHLQNIHVVWCCLPPQDCHIHKTKDQHSCGAEVLPIVNDSTDPMRAGIGWQLLPAQRVQLLGLGKWSKLELYTTVTKFHTKSYTKFIKHQEGKWLHGRHIIVYILFLSSHCHKTTSLETPTQIYPEDSDVHLACWASGWGHDAALVSCQGSFW